MRFGEFSESGYGKVGNNPGVNTPKKTGEQNSGEQAEITQQAQDSMMDRDQVEQDYEANQDIQNSGEPDDDTNNPRKPNQTQQSQKRYTKSQTSGSPTIGKGVKTPVAEAAQKLFEINFNSAEVVKDTLTAPIQCGFEAETTWPDIGNGGGADLFNMSWREIEDLIYDQEGRRSVERVQESFSNWLMENKIPDREQYHFEQLMREYEEDEAKLDDFVSDEVDDEDWQDYKDEVLSNFEDAVENEGEEDKRDEWEEREDWPDDAWQREYVELERLDDFRDWLETYIRDNGEAWELASEEVYSEYDVDDWVREQYDGDWYDLLSDHDIHIAYEDEESGLDAVENLIADWASENSKYKDTRYGGYHSGESVDNEYWRVESDSSIRGDGAKAEIVSPRYNNIGEMLREMKSLFEFFESENVVSNQSTGLHITMSWAGGENQRPNFLKMVLLMGDPYVLKQFDRLHNSYTASQYQYVLDQAKTIASNPDPEGSDFAQLEQMLTRGVNWGKFSSINFKSAENDQGNKVIEFRAAGNDYLDKDFKEIAKTATRYGAVMVAGHDPDAFTKDYQKAVVKLLSKAGDAGTADGGYAGDKVPPELRKAIGMMMQPDARSYAMECMRSAFEYMDTDRFSEGMKEVIVSIINGKNPQKRTLQSAKAFRDAFEHLEISPAEVARWVFDFYMTNQTRVDNAAEKAKKVPEALAYILGKKSARVGGVPERHENITVSPSEIMLIKRDQIPNVTQSDELPPLDTFLKKVPYDAWRQAVTSASKLTQDKDDRYSQSMLDMIQKQYGVHPYDWQELSQRGTVAQTLAKNNVYVTQESAGYNMFNKMSLIEKLNVLDRIDMDTINEATAQARLDKRAAKHGIGKPNTAADEYIALLMKKYGVDNMDDLKKKLDQPAVHESAVPDTRAVKIINASLAKPLPAHDLKTQMVLYSAMPIPEMWDAFNHAREKGQADTSDLRPIIKQFIGHLHPTMREQLGESRGKGLILQAITEGRELSVGDLDKRNNLQVFKKKVRLGEPFMTVDGGEVYLPKALDRKIKSIIDFSQFKNSRNQVYLPLAKGQNAPNINIKQLLKTTEFGGTAASKADSAADSDLVQKFNRGEVAEGWHAAAAYARLIARPSEDITVADVARIIPGLKNGVTEVTQAGDTQNPELADEFWLTISLKPGSWEAFQNVRLVTQDAKLANIVNNIVQDANIESGRRADVYASNGVYDLVRVIGDGVSGETETKTDIEFENETEKKVRGYSIKAGSTSQIHQVGGGAVVKNAASPEERYRILQDELFGVHGRSRIADISKAKSKIIKAAAQGTNEGRMLAQELAYRAAVDSINNFVTTDNKEKAYVKQFAQALKYFQARDDDRILLKQFPDTKKGSTYILDPKRFDKLHEQGLDLMAEYNDAKGLPEISIIDANSGENLVTIRTYRTYKKVPGTKEPFWYLRNYIEKGPLWVKLTNIAKTKK